MVAPTKDETRKDSGSREFVAVVSPHPDGRTHSFSLGRLVLTGKAAPKGPLDLADAREILRTAFVELDRSRFRVAILVTPAGFLDMKLGGSWSGTRGWQTLDTDFDRAAAIAVEVVDELVTSDLRKSAAGGVQHLIVGADIRPTAGDEPHAELACHVDLETGAVIAMTGKSYPTGAQAGQLIRNPQVGNHVFQIGDERVAVLVCHDLAAWSPRGNAVAKGVRASAWLAMQAGVAAQRPTLAVHLPHTINTAGTWQAAWARFAERSGATVRSSATAVRYLTLEREQPHKSFGASSLARTLTDESIAEVRIG